MSRFTNIIAQAAMGTADLLHHKDMEEIHIVRNPTPYGAQGKFGSQYPWVAMAGMLPVSRQLRLPPTS